MDLLDKLRAVGARLAPIEHWPTLPLDTQIDEVVDAGEVIIEGRRTLMFGSNNYLGLTTHPEIRAAAREALDRFGTATTGSRVANGTLGLHRQLEAEFARRFSKRSGIVFTTGYQANLSLITALCGHDDVVLIDAESHASVSDAARLSGAQLLWFRHNSVENLERKLARLPGGTKNKLVVVEGLYSIRGDVAPLREIVAACRAHDAYLMVDEAHSFGVFGERGLGCCEEAGVLDEIDFLVGTFSKALGGLGGFAVSDHPEMRYLHFSARPYVFTASGSPANIAGVLAALRLIDREPERRSRLWSNVRRLRKGLERNGLSIGTFESPIIPILVGDIAATVYGWQALLEAGLYVNVVLPPGCSQDRCQFRASCTAAHTTEQIDRAAEILADVSTRFGFARPVTVP